MHIIGSGKQLEHYFYSLLPQISCIGNSRRRIWLIHTKLEMHLVQSVADKGWVGLAVSEALGRTRFIRMV